MSYQSGATAKLDELSRIEYPYRLSAKIGIPDGVRSPVTGRRFGEA